MFPSFEEAQRVLKVKWSFEGRSLDLEWWSPVGSCVKKGDGISDVWIRILGHPLHMWDSEVFRARGNTCGEFLRVDVETSQRTHFRWAKIAVRAVPTEIPMSVKIAMGGNTYSGVRKEMISAAQLRDRSGAPGVSCPISNRWTVLEDSLLMDDTGKFRVEQGSKGECGRSLEGERYEGAAVSTGLEMVAYFGEEESESLRPGCLLDDETFRHLGWVQDIVDDGLLGSSDLPNPLAVREPDVGWDDGEKLTSGMPQDEVSKWVLKRVSGFGNSWGFRSMVMRTGR
ncbi:hypothetical protein Vadar_022126 [Vaccinium darrowii]|uniref:Uncharacterized protein n=1 Tax=Vaccinium darrowii TaxID=229202 RepID=A0ACB7YYF6_9ERIC|nr:hypothetical protein Vadar_022126 [Vaccinium darrowii]